jgi:hypothetical protein
MSKMIPLQEMLLPTEHNMLFEASQATKDMWLKGIFMQAELRNRNGRVYPLPELTNAVAHLNTQIKEGGGVLGENGHPDNLTIDMMRVSHVITECYMDGNNAIGKLKLINTPAGNVAKIVYAEGVRPAVSSRGAGNVDTSGIVESFALLTVDLVTQNSAPGANPDLIYEALQSSKIMTLEECARHDKDAQKFFAEEVMKVVRNILKK